MLLFGDPRDETFLSNHPDNQALIIIIIAGNNQRLAGTERSINRD